MKLHKICTFFFLPFLLTFNICAQSENLRISIDHDYSNGIPCFQLTICQKGDTVYTQTISDEDDITIDSLAVGRYSINLTNCGVKSDEVIQSMTKNVEIKPHQIAAVYFDLSQYVSYTEVDTVTLQEKITSRIENQLELSYFDYRWNPDGDNPKFNFGMAWSGYYWNAFSKHIGLLLGGGASYLFAPLRVDSISSSIYEEKVKSNYYNYFGGRLDVKLRFSSLNQQRATIKGHTLFFDIGVLYNFPFYFKRVTRFNYQDKMVNSFIHQYTDARAYLNIGFTNAQFFISYRPFDFVRGNLPEIPKYNIGIKLSINY